VANSDGSGDRVYREPEEKFYYSPLAYLPAAIVSILYLVQLKTLNSAFDTDPFQNENQALLADEAEFEKDSVDEADEPSAQ